MTALDDARAACVISLTEDQHSAIMTALTIASENAIPYDAALYASAWEAMRLTAPPTDEWEYGCKSTAHRSRLAAGAMLLEWGVEPSEHGEECPSPAIVRRLKAGRWEPVEAARDAS